LKDFGLGIAEFGLTNKKSSSRKKSIVSDKTSIRWSEIREKKKKALWLPSFGPHLNSREYFAGYGAQGP
jgi:hypothetical protein